MKHVTLIMFVILLSCDENSNVDSSFTITATDHFVEEKSWIIYHDSTTLEPLEVHELKNDQPLELAKTDRATITLVLIGQEYNRKFVSIRSYLNAKTGNWKLKGTNRFYRGKADASTSIPFSNNYKLINFPSYGYGGSLTGPFPVFSLDDNEKMTMLCFATKTGTDSVYCDWLINSDYDSSNTNIFSFNLIHPMTLLPITSSRPLSYVYIGGNRGNFYNSFIESPLFSGTPKTNFMVSYIPAFEVQFYGVRGVYNSTPISYSYTEYGSSPATSLTVSDASVDALYDSTTLRFHNIALSGTCDLLRGTLTYTASSIRVVSMLFADAGSTEISFPIIPDTILTAAGVDYSLLRRNGNIAIDDFDTMNSYDDYINKVFLSNQQFLTVYKSLIHFQKRYHKQLQNSQPFRMSS